MNDPNRSIADIPELTGEKGWTELKVPTTFGKGSSFITGDQNDSRLKVRYFINESDQSFVGRVWFGPSTEGPAGFVHGGSMAAVLDEAMGASAWLSGYTVVAAKIIVDYRKMLPLGTITTIEARVTLVKGRKVTTKGVIYTEKDTIFSESEGLYIIIPPEKFGEMIKYRDAFQQQESVKDKRDDL